MPANPQNCDSEKNYYVTTSSGVSRARWGDVSYDYQELDNTNNNNVRFSFDNIPIMK